MALGGPQRLHGVIDLNAGVDPGIAIQLTLPHFGSSVFAENRHLATRTAEYSLNTPIVARNLDRLRSPGDDLHTVSLDQQIDHKLPWSSSRDTAREELSERCALFIVGEHHHAVLSGQLE